jgi:hypothetical protein
MSGNTTTTPSKHMGTKFLGLFFGMILSVLYTIKEFFTPDFDPVTRVPTILFVWAVFIFVIPLLIYLAEIFWRYAHAYSDKFPYQMSDTMRAVTAL